MTLKLLAGVDTLGSTDPQDSSDIGYIWRLPVTTEGLVTKLQIYTPDGGGADLAAKLYTGSTYDLIEDLGIVAAADLTWNEYAVTPYDLLGISEIFVATNGDTGVTQNRYAESGSLYFKTEAYASWVAGDPFSFTGYAFRSRTLCAGLWGYTAPVITSVNGGSSVTDGDTGVSVVGTDFVDSSGDPEFYLCSTNDFDTAPIKVSQTVTGTPTDIGFNVTISQVGLTAGTVYGFAVSALGQVSDPIAVTLSESSGSTIEYDQSEYYRKYEGLFFPEYWPQAGPHAEQMVSESSEPRFLKTQKGVVNIDPVLTLGGISEDPVIDLDANNFDTTLPGFEVVSNGTDIIKSISEIGYVNDSSLLFDSGDYISKQIRFPYKDDIVIEFIFKPDDTEVSHVVNFGKLSAGPRIYIQCDPENMNISITIEDSLSNYQTFSTQDDIVTSDHFYHVMIFVTGKDSDDGQKYYIYINGELLKTDSYALAGYLSSDYENFLIGSGPILFGPPVADTKFNLTMLRFWHRYKWFTGDQVATVADRYNKYITGEQDYPAPIPVTCFMWGDETGSIPAVMICDNDGVWNLAFHGTSSADIQPGSTELLNGISGVRLCDKYEDYGYCNFDDIKTFDSRIRTIQIPRKYERVIKRIIAQTKTLNSWVVLMIEWI